MINLTSHHLSVSRDCNITQSTNDPFIEDDPVMIVLENCESVNGSDIRKNLFAMGTKDQSFYELLD